MAVYKDTRTGRWVVKIRSFSGHQIGRAVTPENLLKHGVPIPGKITKRTARALEAALMRNLGALLEPEEEKAATLLSEGITRYLAVRVVGKSQTYRDAMVLQDSFLAFLGECPAGTISFEDVERYKASITPGHSPVTVRNYLLDLRRFLGWSVKVGILERDPSKDVVLPRRRKHTIQYLHPEQAETLVAAVRGTSIEGPVLACMNLGVRFGEVVALRWVDVDFERGVVIVRGTKSRSAFRGVPLARGFAEYLEAAPRSCPYLFGNGNGAPVAQSALESMSERSISFARNLADGSHSPCTES